MMKKSIWGVLATVCAAAATLIASSACLWYFYQPEEPSSLSEE